MPPRPRTPAKKAPATPAASKKAATTKAGYKPPVPPPVPTPVIPGKPVTFDQGTAEIIDLQAPMFNIPEPNFEFRIVRPDDLVVLAVRCYAMSLWKDDFGTALVPEGDQAFMIVSYTFQHVGEQAFLEEGFPPFVVEPPTTPVDVLVAEPSRLAYDVAATERIEFSIEGVLAALSRLPLRVVPLATPRPAATQVVKFPLIALQDGTVLQYTGNGLTLVEDLRRKRTKPETVDTLITHSAALRAARTLLVSAGAVETVDHPVLGDITRVPLNRRPGPRPNTRAPRFDETAIEAPWRLIISPSAAGGFTHATKPVHAPHDANRIELWHSRLGVRNVDKTGHVTIDERDDPQRAIRAVWARDDDGAQPPSGDTTPFRASLKGQDRSVLVTESADTSIATPQPVDAHKLYLSSQGAWLDLHGHWDTDLYGALEGKIESWDHIAPMGRDQYVKVVYPGYLYPFGHKASFIKVTERRIDAGSPPVAYLYQHFFIVVRQPVLYYDSLDMPFTKVALRPVVTPFLDDPDGDGNPNAFWGQDLFWPALDGTKFEFTLDCLDRDGRRVLMPAPLLFVSASFGSTKGQRNLVTSSYTTPDAGQPAPRAIAALSQSIALAQSVKPGDTAFETHALRFTADPGTPTTPTSTPHLTGAQIVVPAMKHLAPAADQVDVHYAKPYLDHSFTGVNSTPQVFLELDTMAPISFGDGSAAASTEKSGGFLQPSLPVRGLSRTLGTVGQVDKIVNPPPGTPPFDPKTYLDGVLPKLFGLFSLWDILKAVGLDKAPSFVTETLNEVAQLLADLQALEQALTNGVAELNKLATTSPTAPLKASASAAQGELEAMKTLFAPKLSALTNDVSALTSSGDVATFTANANTVLTDLGAVLTALDQKTKTLQLPPVVKAQLQRLIAALAPLMDGAKIAKQIQSIVAFAQGLDPSNLALKCSFEWQPTLQNFPAGSTQSNALFYVDPHGLLLSIEARASGKDGVGVDVLAQLSNFGLNLFEDSTLITIGIDRLAFRASNGHKPEVDVVMRGMQWLGALSFIETLETLIPSDGFSDPPYVDVSPSGVKAGFDLALPSIGVGVFSLENISLGADVNVPFLGDAVTVGFYFCKREKPFRLTVMCVGGGGFVGIRLSPKGLVLLEMSLEACAQLGIDLGVASGSVSITIGVYLRLEGKQGSLTGYFRIRGEVDVLGGIFSASITLELSLTYQFDTGKLTGRASIQIEVTIFFFSFGVEVSCQRTLAGSNNDPTFAELLGITNNGQDVPDPGAPDGGTPAWTDYCNAFASV